MSKLDDEISERVKTMSPASRKAYATKKLDPTLCRKVTFAIGAPELKPFAVMDGSMDNVLAYRLGSIAYQVGHLRAGAGVGDEIDRGLILVEEMRKKGFQIIYVGKKPI